ncbi:TIGR01620 family protein [Vibrio sp. 10N.286.49.B3]|uniref:YcjF family protein n=1 Tax=Vibrio sp. 10N.286.49.B3 TaxID=1880855 RepID=UPI000C81A5A3|nr:TIGR01620 family protein [Vibrio sp. 10N.286.49.B3]PMH46571.1 TIGR01620 family protein [Vibrio sp. 10N.286.49.B3]
MSNKESRDYYEPAQVFSGDLNTQQLNVGKEKSPELASMQEFTQDDEFKEVVNTVDVTDDNPLELEQVIRPKKGRLVLLASGIATFGGLLAWQAVDNVMSAISQADWLALGWSGFIAVIASLGFGALGKELWTLSKLRRHFSVQEQSEQLLEGQGVGKGVAFCQKLATSGGIIAESPAFDRWKNSVNPAHSDAEILEMYDAIVISEQDKKATKIVTQYSGESAVMVAISPLAIADMLLVAWRNFKMVDQLAQVYGVELGYWSRLKLFKLVLVNMAMAGASEVAVDASMDMLSMDLAGKVSARAGQGLGVGILTARLGIKAMSLLRPIPWKKPQVVKLSAIRKQITAKVKQVVVK